MQGSGRQDGGFWPFCLMLTFLAIICIISCPIPKVMSVLGKPIEVMTMYSNYLDATVEDLEQDLGMRLVTTETSREDVLETETSWNGDAVGYSTTPVLQVTATAQGFVWEHPHGATIRANFPKPIIVADATLNDDGEKIEFECHGKPLALAILAALGPVAAIDPILLGMAGKPQPSRALI